MKLLNRHIITRLLALWCIAVFAACSQDDEPVVPPVPDVDDSSYEFAIYLAVGDRESVLSSTPDGEYDAGQGYENYIDVASKDYRIYLFDNDNTLIYAVPGDDITLLPLNNQTDGSKRYELRFKVDDKIQGLDPAGTTFKLVMLANWRDYPYELTPGTTKISDLMNSSAAKRSYTPAVTSVERTPSLTLQWKTLDRSLNDSFDWGAPNWASETAVKAHSCTRFATPLNGKLYSVNMKTMSLMEFDEHGNRDVYKLPKLSGSDYYGTGITHDDAGNLLIGHYFTSTNASGHWTVYSPATGEAQNITLDIPAYRIDCLGRVDGDLTRKAQVYIAPGNADTKKVAMVTFHGYGDYKNITTETTLVPVALGSTVDFCQPGSTDNSFYFYSDHSLYNYSGGKLSGNLASGWGNVAKTNAFDTFVLDGKRYFVVNYLKEKGDFNSVMDIAIFDEAGKQVATWSNPDYISNAGYSTICVEPVDESNVNIYVYNCTGSFEGAATGAVAAAKLRFSLSDTPVHTISAEERIPMFGVNKFDNVVLDPVYITRLGSLHLLRAYAKIEVYDKPADSTGDASGVLLKNVTLTRHSASGYNAPMLSDWLQGEYVTSSYASDYGISFRPTGDEVSESLPLCKDPATGHFIIYVPEFTNVGKQSNENLRAQLRLEFEDGRVNTLDFMYYDDVNAAKNGAKKGDLFNISRNCWYRFVVNRSSVNLLLQADVVPYKSVYLNPSFGFDTALPELPHEWVTPPWIDIEEGHSTN